MQEIWIALAILGGMGLIFGLVLAVASKVFAVETDPRLEELTEALPGANCGGCGYAGCAAYAEAVLKGQAEIGKCASAARRLRKKWRKLWAWSREPSCGGLRWCAAPVSTGWMKTEKPPAPR